MLFSLKLLCSKRVRCTHKLICINLELQLIGYLFISAHEEEVQVLTNKVQNLEKVIGVHVTLMLDSKLMLFPRKSVRCKLICIVLCQMNKSGTDYFKSKFLKLNHPGNVVVYNK